MANLQDQDPVVVMTAFLCAMLVAPVVIYLLLRLSGRRGNPEPSRGMGGISSAGWPPGASESAEPYQVYFEQLNSMLEPVEPFSLDQFKASCSAPPALPRVRFNNEGGFTTEPALSESESSSAARLEPQN